MNMVRAFVGRHPLAIFFALSYLIAWSMLPFGTFLPFAPLVSAILSVSAQRFALAYITPKRVSNLLSNRVPSPTPKRAWT